MTFGEHLSNAFLLDYFLGNCDVRQLAFESSAGSTAAVTYDNVADLVSISNF